MEKVMVYGFGSAFAKAPKPTDIDLLILHETTKFPSCKFAILCKHAILRNLTEAHVTILSIGEEFSLKFIETSNAVFLGVINSSNIEMDAAALIASTIHLDYKVTALRAPHP
jgi:hypothetical protein